MINEILWIPLTNGSLNGLKNISSIIMGDPLWDSDAQIIIKKQDTLLLCCSEKTEESSIYTLLTVGELLFKTKHDLYYQQGSNIVIK